MTDISFLLFISEKNDPKSKTAMKNLEKICKDREFNLTVLDLSENPKIAKSLNIIATPFLIKTLPKPLKKIIGDLSNLEVNSVLENANNTK